MSGWVLKCRKVGLESRSEGIQGLCFDIFNSLQCRCNQALKLLQFRSLSTELWRQSSSRATLSHTKWVYMHIGLLS